VDARARSSEGSNARRSADSARARRVSDLCLLLTNALYRILDFWLVHWREHKNYAKLTGKFMMLVAMLQPNGLAT